MATQMSVVVLTPNGRRHTVKCNPNTTILQILEQTCTKHDFNPEDYDLTHHNRVIDASTILRFSGLPNNAFLEMCSAKQTRKESEVVIGLQLENGSRIMGTFSPSTNLFAILNELAADECEPESNPVVIYMRREVYSVENLKATTLKSLGLTGGRAILRLVHRTPEQLKTQANVSAPILSKLKDIDEIPVTDVQQSAITKKVIVPSTSIIEPPINKEEPIATQILPHANNISETTANTSVVSNEKIESIQTAPSHPETNPVSDVDMESNTACSLKSENNVKKAKEYNYDEDIIILGERNALVFSQNLTSQFSYDDLPDDFYELSVPEVKKLFIELGQKRAELENIPLQTTSLRSLEENKRIIKQLHDYKKVVLRILFPDRIVLQGDFKPLDSIQTVKDFVKSYLETPDDPFDLYVTPPKQILNPEMSLVDANCVPCVLIHFGSQSIDREMDTSPAKQYLKDEILSKLTSPEAALFSASQIRGLKKLSKPFSTINKDESKNKSQSKLSEAKVSQASTTQETPRPRDPNIPKWFKPT